MHQESSEFEKEIIIRHFDEMRAKRALQEAEEAVILDGIVDADLKRVAKDLLFLINNPDKTLPPVL